MLCIDNNTTGSLVDLLGLVFYEGRVMHQKRESKKGNEGIAQFRWIKVIDETGTVHIIKLFKQITE